MYDTKTFVEKAQLKRGLFYDYSKLEYLNNNTKVKIICPIHGEFLQLPSNHLAGQNCPKCGAENRKNNTRLTTEEFIEKAKVKHNNFYSYENSEYFDKKTPVIITCPIHGDFEQTPDTHLQGRGCTQCGKARAKIEHSKLKITTEEFITSSKKIHNNKYIYIHTNYQGRDKNVLINCPIHGRFKQKAGNHLNGSGCPSCAKGGFDPKKSAILYYLSINNGEAYKIGITNSSVAHRFSSSELKRIKILYTEPFKIGKDAYDKEQEILKKYKQYKYIGKDLLKVGNTELFNRDILELDTME